MRGRKELLYLATAAICFLPLAAQAQDQPLDAGAILERGYENRPELSYSSEVEVGIGYNSEDSFKFGEYNGLEDDGLFAVGNVIARQRAPFDGESTQYWEVIGTDLGLDSRNVYLGYGQQGTFDLFFEYDQIPHNQIDDARTPFRGAGGDNLTLPPGFDRDNLPSLMDTLQSDLRDVEIETERKDLGGGITWHLDRNWSISGEYHHQFKEGTDTIAAIFGTNGGNPASAILPEPIDYETDEVDVALSYAGARAQLEVSYEGSWFTNNDDSLTWDNPFDEPPSGSAWVGDTSRGQLGLPPDNQAHRISVAGGYSLTDTTKVTGLVSYARMMQDDEFLPYTINPGIATVGLPRQSLDGEINNILANFAITARPTSELDLSARYRFDDRDNDTPRDAYFTVGGDAGNQETDPRLNLPYSVTQHLINLDAGYRILPDTKILVGYELDYKDRDYTVVETTRDHTFKGRVQTSPLDYLDGWAQYALTIRDGSEYVGNRPLLASHPLDDPDDFENHPYLRKFFLADRNTNDFSAGVSVMASEQTTLGVSGGLTFNDYKGGDFGLDESTLGHITLDAGFSPRDDMTAYAFYTYEQNNFKQDGYSFRPGGAIPVDPASLWSVDTRDRVHTIGGRVEWAAIPDKLDIAAEYTFSKALTGFDIDAGSEVPDLESTINSLGISADYHLESNMSLKFAYRFETLTTEDFALDRVEVDNTRVVGLGESSPDYTAHVFAVSFKYKF